MSVNNINAVEKHKGFTLVEILISLAISSVLILGIHAAYQQAYMIWSKTEGKRPAYHTARIITDTLKHEISSLYMPPEVAKEEQNQAFKLSNIPGQGIELAFYTLSPAWKSDFKTSHPAKVTYRFIREPDTGRQMLERNEQSFSGEKEIGLQSTDIITKDLSEFRIQVIDPNDKAARNSWKSSYQSRDTPPKAVKVSMRSTANEDSPSINFESYFLISMNSPVL